MTDPDAVASALSRLATGVPRASKGGECPEPVDSDFECVVADAEAAMQRVDSAAAFLDAGGEARLRRAVQTADRRNESAIASRGQAVLTTLEAFRTAANHDSTEPARNEPQTTSTPLAQRSSGEGS